MGDKLVEAVGPGAVGIDGRYGNDWWYADEHFRPLGESYPDQAAIVGLALSRDRLQVAPGEPIAVFDPGIEDYRGWLAKEGILVPVRPDEYPTFWVTETRPRITVPAGYTGVLNVVKLGEGWAVQTLSLLAKGGETPGWRLRVEVAMEDGRRVDRNTTMDGPEDLVPVDFAADPLCIYMGVWKDRRPAYPAGLTAFEHRGPAPIAFFTPYSIGHVRAWRIE